MWNSITGAALRTAFAFLLVMVLARLMGRKLIFQMTFFNFIIGVTLGSVTANFCLESPPTVDSAAATLLTLTGLSVLSGYLHIKSFLARKLADSEPVAMIANAGLTKDLIIDGEIMMENLEDAKLSPEWIIKELLDRNIPSVRDVFYAGLDTQGGLYISLKNKSLEKQGQYWME